MLEQEHTPLLIQGWLFKNKLMRYRWNNQCSPCISRRTAHIHTKILSQEQSCSHFSFVGSERSLTSGMNHFFLHSAAGFIAITH